MKRLLIFAALLSSVTVYGQKVTSGRSNTIQLELNGISPTITWISPETYETSLTEKMYSVKVGIKSQGQLKSADLYLNEDLVGESRGFKPATGSGFDKVVERELSLSPGDNIVKIVAVSMDEVTTTDMRVLKVAGGEMVVSNRTDRALFFGIDTYDEWGNLFNPVKDVETIAEELKTSYGFETEVIIDATTSEIMAKLREYAKISYQPNDQLLIFFAGHGQFDEIFAEGYLVGTDSKLDDPGKTSYISHSTLRTVINNIPSGHTLLTLDACFGGTFDPLLARSGSRGGGEDMYTDITTSEFIERKLRFKTRKYITSGGKQYVADGKPGGHSPFARKFLQGLRGYGGADKILTLQEMYGYLLNLKMEPHAGEFGDNEPGSDFVFVAR
jgi:hypothetical protein